MKGICGLCKKDSILKMSHIIPKFIHKWQKETSATGHRRSGENINKRVQDSTKIYLLCGDCENLFNKWETYFANSMFLSLIGDEDNIKYDANFLKFCVSVSWRVAVYFKKRNLLSHLSPTQLKQMDKALLKWENFLLGKHKNPGKYGQYILNFAGEWSCTDSPPNIHRYLQRYDQLDVIAGNDTVLVISKLPGFLIAGCINLKTPSQWQPLRICLKRGYLRHKDIFLPDGIWDYLKTKAARAIELNESISTKQKIVIAKDYKKNIDKAATSDTLRSLGKDVKVFGVDKVFKNKK